MIHQKVLAKFYLIVLVIPIFIFFNTSVQNLNTPYIIPKKFQHFLDEDISESFSILGLNIRSIEILFETFKNLLSALNFNFSIMFFWDMMKEISKIQIINFQFIIVYIKLEIIAKGGGILIFIKKEFNFKFKDDLSINCKDVESLCVELLLENKHNTLINNVLYRPLNGQIESFEKNLKYVFSITKNSKFIILQDILSLTF